MQKSKTTTNTRESSMEQRLTALESQVAELMEVFRSNSTVPVRDWMNSIGIFTDKPGALKVLENAMKLREADRSKVRRSKRRVKA